ncbi:phage baseplate assembly protein V [Pedobacter jeongneungensis]|uniref:Phage baseplate assembly protein V n=1 Tax=Pedobacter jeongneungensis TaxID=947309 RepID=A0ABP8BJA3_9SPHI
MSTANKVRAEIFVDGGKISHFTYLKLSQSFNNHHEFELHLSLFDLGFAGTFDVYQSRNWIGKDITIELFSALGQSANKFKGLVTKISVIKAHGQSGGYVLSGYSPTIKLDGGAIMRSFNQLNLEAITAKVLKAGGVEVQINVNRNATLGYFTQYKESNFDFINRISALYGEWFFYNGEQLCFGMPDKLEEIQLVYGRDIEQMDFSMRVAHLNFSNYSYNSENDQVLSATAKPDTGGLSEHSLFAIQQSQETFNEENNTPLRNRITSQKELDDILKVKKAAVSNDLVGINAVGDNPAVALGKIVKIINSQREELNFVEQDEGSYLVLSVTHEIQSNNEYKNHFYGIDAGADVIPVYNIKIPIAESQIAKVVDNNDPKGMGRVKVQMLWQTGADKTEWIRVLTPDAGSSDKVSKNRGFAFVPETGDQVLIGFRYNDANRPFVMGSMYHGKIGAGGGETNKTKSLTTRSGCSVILDDSKGSATVKDPSGNILVMHGDGTITLTAPNTFTINTKDFIINASNSIAINAQPGEEGGGEGTININAKKSITTVAQDENITTSAKKDISFTSHTENIKLTSSAKDIAINADNGTLKTSSKKAALSSTDEMNLDGGTLAKIGATDVEINQS